MVISIFFDARSFALLISLRLSISNILPEAVPGGFRGLFLPRIEGPLARPAPVSAALFYGVLVGDPFVHIEGEFSTFTASSNSSTSDDAMEEPLSWTF